MFVFVCYVDDLELLFVEGCWVGEIVDMLCGEYGFGYDLYFYLLLFGVMVVEFEFVVKNMYSYCVLVLKVLFVWFVEEV